MNNLMTRHNYKYLLVILAMVCMALPTDVVGMTKMPDTSKQGKQQKNSTSEESEGFGDQLEGGGTRWIDPVILYNLQDINRTDYTRSYDQGDIDVNKEIVSKGYKIYGIRVKPICAAGVVEKYAYYTYLGADDFSFSFSYQNMYGVKGEPLSDSWFCIYPNESISRTYTFEYTATGTGSKRSHHETTYNSIKITGLRFAQTSSGISFSYALDGKATHHHKCSDSSDPKTYTFKSQKGNGANAKYGHFIYFKGAPDLLLILGAPGIDPDGDVYPALQCPWGRVYFIVEQVQVDAGIVAAVEGVELQSHESEKAEVDETEETDADADETEEGEHTDEGEESEDGGILPDDMIKLIENWFAGDPLGLGKEATPAEAVGIGSIAALLAALLGGGAGALGGGVGGALGGLAGGAGGAGGAIPPPIEGAPSGPPPIQNPYQGVEDKYVTRHPDGSITVKDPVTGEPKLYLPDGEGGYDNPLGGGYKSEEAMLDHLAMLDRNKGVLSQDAATAAQNQAEQHAQWEAQNARDLERGYSDEMADYKQWKDETERKENQIIKLAGKYGVEATEEAVKQAIRIDQIKAGIESAKQQAEAARNDMIVVGLESTKNVAATSIVLIPLAASGAGVLSATSLAKAKLVQSCFTMATSVTDKVGDAYVNGDNMGMAAVHGVVIGTVSVAQNYAGDMGGLAKEAAVVIGGEGFKAGYNEYTSSGDLNKTLDATISGLKDGAKTHAINKTMEFGINKAKGWATSGKPTVESTRAHADVTGKNLTSSKQAATRAQNQLSTAQQRATAAQQNAVRSQQLVTKAKGDGNAANKQLRAANKQVTTAQQKLNNAKTPAEISKAKADLTNAQRGAAQAQQNVDRANSNLKMTQNVDAAARRVATNADNNLQRAQLGAQKAQSDLKTANEQHNQALRDAYAAEQQAQIDKTMTHVSGSDIVTGGRSFEDFLKNEGYISSDDNK